MLDSTPSRGTVFSFVANPCTHDSRVLKESAALRDAGYKVRVYCSAAEGLPKQEVVNGIEFIRYQCFNHRAFFTDAVRQQSLDMFGSDQNAVLQALSSWARKDASLLALAERARTKLAQDGGKKDHVLKTAVKSAAVDERETRRHYWAYLKYYWFTANLLSLKFDVVPDFIHAHDLYPVAGAICLARRTGAKVIYDAHEIEVERFPPLDPHLKAFTDRYERRLLDSVEHVITVNDFIANYYAQRFVGQPTVVMNAPDQVEASEPLDLRAAANLSSDDPLVVYTGSVSGEARGLHLVVAALKLLPNYNLAIIGRRKETDDAWLMERAAAEGVAARVHLLDPVPSDSVVAACASADVGIAPIQDACLSYRHCLPNKLFEMAFAQIPVCVSDLPEMASIVTQFNIGVVMNQTDPADIARALSSAYANREAHRLETEALADFRERFGWRTQATNLVKAYRQLDDGSSVRIAM